MGPRVTDLSCPVSPPPAPPGAGAAGAAARASPEPSGCSSGRGGLRRGPRGSPFPPRGSPHSPVPPGPRAGRRPAPGAGSPPGPGGARRRFGRHPDGRRRGTLAPRPPRSPPGLPRTLPRLQPPQQPQHGGRALNAARAVPLRSLGRGPWEDPPQHLWPFGGPSPTTCGPLEDPHAPLDPPNPPKHLDGCCRWGPLSALLRLLKRASPF